MVDAHPVSSGTGLAGQGLAEYCLITAFIALAALAILIHISGGLQSIWNQPAGALATGANQPASPAAATAHPSRPAALAAPSRASR